MSEELVLDGKQYVSSKRASNLSGYAQDYIGQLARKGLIDAQRVGGLWYVYMDSLTGYKKNADEFKPMAPQFATPAKDPESFVTFDGKDYVSASRAAKITGYNQDYIGQLARKGAILSRQIGNRWYVDRDGLQTHKREKDALLAAVQAESVGITRATPVSEAMVPTPAPLTPNRADEHVAPLTPAHDLPPVVPPIVSAMQAIPNEEPPFFTYIQEHQDLMPRLNQKDAVPQERAHDTDIDHINEPPAHEEVHSIPIKVDRSTRLVPTTLPPVHYQPVKKSGKTIFTATKVLTALTIVLVLSVGIVQLKDDSKYAIADTKYAAGVYAAVDRIYDLLEEWIVPELIYRRSE